MTETDDARSLIRRALAGDAGGVRILVDRLSPVIGRRVIATLRHRTRRRNVSQDVDDMIQEVFVSLFQAEGKALRAWDPERGMTLDRFVGMLAEHQTISILRNGRTSPWRDDPTDTETLDAIRPLTVTPETISASREKLGLLLDRLRETLSLRGLEVFQRLIVDEEPVSSVMAATGLSRDAVYQWKTRLLQTMRSLVADFDTPVMSESTPRLRIAKGTPRR